MTDEMSLVEANDRMGTALTLIGMELGLPRPGPQCTWGADQIMDKATELWTEHLHYRALRMGLRMLLHGGPLAIGYTLTIYGPGDQELVDAVHELLLGHSPSEAPARPLAWDEWDQVTLPMAKGTPPCVVLPAGWVIWPEATARPDAKPNPLFDSGQPGATGVPDAPV